jgi:hypothetical protein
MKALKRQHVSKNFTIGINQNMLTSGWNARGFKELHRLEKAGV